MKSNAKRAAITYQPLRFFPFGFPVSVDFRVLLFLSSTCVWNCFFVFSPLNGIPQCRQESYSLKTIEPQCRQVVIFPAISTPQLGHIGAWSLTLFPHSGQPIIAIFFYSYRVYSLFFSGNLPTYVEIVSLSKCAFP